MQKQPDEWRGEVVYRRVLPQHWSLRNGKLIIKPAAFYPSEGEGLSVFSSAIVKSARYVLADHVLKQKDKLDDPDTPEAARDKIRNRIANGILTVEGLYREGWRIVALNRSEFPSEFFYLEPPEPDGHLNVTGAYDDFLEYATLWVEQARMLTEHECLQD